MLLYEKKILYLTLYRSGNRECGGGFVKFIEKAGGLRMDIQIKKDCCREEGRYLLCFLAGENLLSLGELSVQAGGISASRYFKTDEEKVYIQGRAYEKKDIYGVKIEVSEECCLAGYWKKKSEPKQEERPLVTAAEMEEEKFTEICTFDNKWEQLLHDYPQIHPFGDERTFISIEPRDFIVLSASYQKLVNNSFLLHGFYNYRYLILGPDRELGDDSGECFYLGVPGTFFEREKMVAVMFGFEGFECDGPVEVGRFGYYLRRVEL